MNYNLQYVSPSSKADILSLTECSCFREHELGMRVYDNSYVVPADMSQQHFHRGVMTSKGDVVNESLLFEGFEPDWADAVDISKAKIRHEEVIYLGWLEPVWGHILTDCLKKLWFLKTEECKKLLESGVRLVAIVPWRSNTLSTIFSMLDIPFDNVEVINELTRFDKVYIPDNSFVATTDDRRFYTKEYCATIEQLFNKIPETKSTGKLYFSRELLNKGKWYEKREYGEEVLSSLFSKNGYKVIYPEKNSVIENLILLRNCDAFASTEGSISHNVLFCKPSTPVCIIRKVDYTNSWQIACNEVSKVDVTYIDAHKSVISTGCLGPFYICMTKYLKNYFKIQTISMPYWLKISFWWYLVQNRRVTKRIVSLLS